MDSVVDALKTAWISIDCPVCNFEIRCRIASIALQEFVHCRGCHETIHLIDKDASTVQAFRRASNAVDDIRNALNRIK